MKNMKMIIMTSMALVVLASGLSFGEEKVEVTKEQGGLKFVTGKDTKGYIKPRFSAEYAADDSIHANLETLVSTEVYKTMSDLQKEYLQEQIYLEKKRNIDSRRKQQTALNRIGTRNEISSWYAFAVSEEDVKKMPEAFLEAAELNRMNTIQQYKESAGEESAKIPKLQAEVDAFDKQTAPLAEQRESLERSLNPSLLDGNQAIIKIHDQLDEYKVKMRGNEARRRAIGIAQHEFREKLDVSKSSTSSSERQAINAMILKYEEMQADLEIEMAGVEAEMRVLQERLAMVESYWDLTNKHGRLNGERGKKDRELNEVKKSHKKDLWVVNNLQQIVVEIYEEEVTIVQLRR